MPNLFKIIFVCMILMIMISGAARAHDVSALPPPQPKKIVAPAPTLPAPSGMVEITEPAAVRQAVINAFQTLQFSDCYNAYPGEFRPSIRGTIWIDPNQISRYPGDEYRLLDFVAMLSQAEHVYRNQDGEPLLLFTRALGRRWIYPTFRESEEYGSQLFIWTDESHAQVRRFRFDLGGWRDVMAGGTLDQPVMSRQFLTTGVQDGYQLSCHVRD